MSSDRGYICDSSFDDFFGYAARVMNATDGNAAIKMKILKGEPFSAARMGATECQAIKRYLMKKARLSNRIRQYEIDSFQTFSGFFPPDEEMVGRYAEFILQLMPEVDVFACWNTTMEHYFVNRCLKRSATLAAFQCLEPYYHEKPWSAALGGKKVLVIHPFAVTIEKQYQKRHYLFKSREVLPDFELKTIKAIQTILGLKSTFLTWFEALEHMYQQAMSIEFDVAIIGCGAYAFPLACKLKKSGRSAITMCGATQVLFGIKGNGWRNNQRVLSLYNFEWVSASKEETPAEYKKVEDGCYW